MPPQYNRRVPHDKDRIEELRKKLQEYDRYGFLNDKDEAFISKAIDMDEKTVDPTQKSCSVSHKKEGEFMVWQVVYRKKIMGND